MTRRGQFLLILALLGAGVAVQAQTPDIDLIEGRLKTISDDVQRISGQFDVDNVADATLTGLLQKLFGYQDTLSTDSDTLTSAAVEPGKRLDDLGPPPADGQPAESPDIATLRENLTNQVSRLTGLIKTVDLTQADVERLIVRIRGQQRARFHSSLFKRSQSPFSTTLWREAAGDLSPTLRAATDHFSAWWRDQRASGTITSNLALIAVGFAGAIALLMAPHRPRWRKFEARMEESSTPSSLEKRRRVAERAMSRGVLSVSAGALLFWVALEVDLLGQPEKYVAVRIWLGVVALVFIWSFARSIFEPGCPEWRVAEVDSRAAGLLQYLLIAIFGLFAADRFTAAATGWVGAGPELPMAQAAVGSSLFAVLLWLFLSPKLWHTSESSVPATDDATGASRSSAAWPTNVLRFTGRLIAILILAATGLAYLRLANFAFHRVVLSALFLIFIWSSREVARWGLDRLATERKPATDPTQDSTSSGTGSLGFWLHLALDLNLLALAVPGFFLIVGFDWLDLRHWIGLLGTDIHIGAVSVSFTNILTAVAAFLLVTIATRWTTGFLDKRLLQRSHFGAGERNSITTLIKYVGVAVAALIALALVGVGLSRLAIVAGALSVGIGFGLQGIVNNFVSGLILLFERPIEIGDWIVVSSGEGYVKQIGARATEIQTFDQASIIIPNSELVTSAVKNWFFHSRKGRLRVDVGVSHGSDPDQVRDILLDCAKTQSSVSTYPEATVRWTEFGDSSLQFQLRAYVRDYDDAFTIKSDLRFAIFKAFKEAGVVIPFPQRDLHIRPDGTPVGEVAARGQEVQADDNGESDQPGLLTGFRSEGGEG